MDRRQVYAWQHVQPSRTNRPRGLIHPSFIVSFTRSLSLTHSHLFLSSVPVSPRTTMWLAGLSRREMVQVAIRHLLPLLFDEEK